MTRIRPTVFAAVLAGVMASTVALAQQTQPGAPNGYNSGFNPGYQPTAFPEQFNYHNLFYPAPEVRALPGLRAAATAARAELRRAERDLNNTINDLRRQFHRSADLREALADEKEAWDELQRVQTEATSHLKNDPSYAASVELRKRLAEQIADYRDRGDKSLESMLAMATVKLGYSATATAMEAAALAGDPQVREARRRLMAAAARTAQIREQFDEAFRSSPEVALARKALADARTIALAADAAYIEAAHVANVAFDFAYFIRRHPQPYVVGFPYYPHFGGHGGFGYKIGYPIGWHGPQVPSHPLPHPHPHPRPK